ncbi:hypothetical protein AJ78_04459 [Emergomyces pasteurianus Ep9510]|uniref:Fe2OG dioxygenase domain-containing protein n=1 Tax=Emergomyces pasteurianus Ep9510 TaxID=1447872 RepID=A0A1J9PH88_9EURO|nr:hypothetical protein AJ78_04459 [Emergomyces pasteurianus Ep9510]
MANDQEAKAYRDATEEVILPIHLEEARITTIPETAYYIPMFITQDEEEQLLHKITSVPIPRWTQLSRRRLQTWPSALSKSNTLLASPLPQWLISPIISRYKELGIFRDSPHKAPNHVLINEYQPGQGIMPHEDGAAYYPVVATVSLGAPIVLEMKEKTSNGKRDALEHPERATASQFKILQERRSLLITTGKLYTDFLHGIEERKTDANLNSETVCNWSLLGDKNSFAAGSYERETRISLTYRNVLKISKWGNSMKFFGSK